MHVFIRELGNSAMPVGWQRGAPSLGQSGHARLLSGPWLGLEVEPRMRLGLALVGSLELGKPWTQA